MTHRHLILITDGLSTHEWQRRALETLPLTDRISVFACTNTGFKRRLGKHLFYYVLNMLAVRNPLTRQVPLGDIGGRIESVEQFECEWDGNWQRLPENIAGKIAASGSFAIVKFGMGLMRIPGNVDIPILSYHHGDPDYYRGRPAGFYEMANGAPIMGQMVQRISDKLDAGDVLAFAETRVLRHSWRKTLIESFRHSPLLLNIALANVAAATTIPKQRNGKNYRLPSNIAVAGHVLRSTAFAIKRLFYGIFAEKNWRVATVNVENSLGAHEYAVSAAPFPLSSKWKNASAPRGYSFLADPFFAPDGSLLVEAMEAKSGLGALLRIDAGAATKLNRAIGHHSYPSVVEESGNHYCVPEIAGWSPPLVYPLETGTDGEMRLGEATPLDFPDPGGLSDPTFLRHGGRLWLFANRKDEGSNVLRLWSANSLFSRFVEHSHSPVRISPDGGRMAGNLLQVEGRLYRLGQNFEVDYGDGISVFEVSRLDDASYVERRLGGLRFKNCKGPHSFNLSPDGKKVVFDWYSDRYTPMAGVRRLRSRLKI